jgi:cyclopropane fatty-acyl-phospholipid synthase-like methyltransferase
MLKTLGKQLRQPSGIFGRFVAKMMDIRNRKFYEKTIAELNIKKGDKIYEIGYGPGLGVNLIATKTPDCSISGIDFSELMHSKATKRNKKFIDSGRVNLRFGDLLTADNGNEKYDKIFCVNVIYFWSDLNRVFEKIYSMLNNDGTYCIFMTPAKDFEKLKFAKDFLKYPIEEVESELKKVGFKNVESKLDNGYYIKSKK